MAIKDLINSMKMRTGRLIKEDDTYINEADELEKISSTFDPSNRQSMNTVFGEKIIGIRKPSIASQFMYPVPADRVTVVQENGGTISQVENLLVGQTGTASNGEASVTTRENVRYFPGNEAYCFFTAIYTEGVEDSIQRAGLLNDDDGFWIGYEGADFCIGRKRVGTEYVTTQEDFNVDKLDGTGDSGFVIFISRIYQINILLCIFIFFVSNHFHGGQYF